MLLKNIKGLKFPDEYIIRFFYKENLQLLENCKVLELGSSNGNNLNLFYQYDWNISGVDINPVAIENANSNFNLLGLKGEYAFINSDMTDFIEKSEDSYHVILFPNCLNYLSIFNIKKLFQQISQKQMIKPEGKLFLRIRSPKDYRFGKGNKIDYRSFEMTSNETNELGCINTFFNEHEVIQLISQFFNYKDLKLFTCEFTNLIGDTHVYNSDIIVWCTIV